LTHNARKTRILPRQAIEIKRLNNSEQSVVW
jgi:hypothetical protein